MKRKNITTIIALFCISVFCISMLSACAQGGSASAGTMNGKGLHAMLTISDGSDAFRSTLASAAQEAAQEAGMTLTIEDAAGSIEAQMNQIKNAKDADVIICALCDSSTAQEMEVIAGDTPIVFINSCPEEDYLERNRYVYVGSDEAVAGGIQAEYVLEKCASKNTLNVVIIKGEKTHSATKGRTRAAKSVLEASGKTINYVFEDYADWSTDDAKNMFNLFLKTGQEVDCVISNNDSMALGVVAAAKENGIDLQAMPILGVDATTDGLAAVAAGDMACTVFQPAKGQGEAAVKAAITLVKGGDIASLEGAEENGMYVWVPFESVTESNVKEYQ